MEKRYKIGETARAVYWQTGAVVDLRKVSRAEAQRIYNAGGAVVFMSAGADPVREILHGHGHIAADDHAEYCRAYVIPRAFEELEHWTRVYSRLGDSGRLSYYHKTPDFNPWK